VNPRIQFGVALALQLIGAGAALLVSTREWQTIRTPREGLPVDVLGVSGRNLDSAPLAFALVGLAGVVAILATQGPLRRAIGLLVALAGAALIWRSATSLAAVSAGRARDLVRSKHPRVTLSNTLIPSVSTHPIWGVLSIASGVVVVAAGVLIAVRGGHWAAMSARYERPAAEPDVERDRLVADRSMWNALDRGEDPTSQS
jgi:uncharacterized membrane protein (TIGR02234 family)